MAQTAITAKVHESLDIHGDLATQIAFDFDFAVNQFADFCDLGFRQIIRSGIRINLRFRKNILSDRTTDAVNVGQGDLNPFVSRQIYTSNTCQCPTLLTC